MHHINIQSGPLFSFQPTVTGNDDYQGTLQSPTDTHRQTHRYTDIQIDTHRYTDPNTQTHRQTQTRRHRHTETEKDTEGERERLIDHTYKYRHSQVHTALDNWKLLFRHGLICTAKEKGYLIKDALLQRGEALPRGYSSSNRAQTTSRQHTPEATCERGWNVDPTETHFLRLPGHERYR